MTNKNKIKQIISGIFSSTVIWISAILLSGKMVSGDVLDLGYSDLGLGKIFFLLFFGYNIFIALYSKKRNIKYFFNSAFIAEIIPLSTIIIALLSNFTPLINETIVLGLSVLFSTPVGSVFYSFPESEFLTVLTSIVVFASPIVSLVIYKIKCKG
jgi:1,4-dihydroxy-2-naphthoate octaprenyltransferase